MPNPVEHWRRVERVLDGALDLDADQRAEYLSKTCAGDPELRAEVEAWLRCCEAVGGFLESPAHRFALPLLACGTRPRSGCGPPRRGAS
jgi:hypothetical protein